MECSLIKAKQKQKTTKKIKGEFLTKFSAKTRAGKEKMGRKWGRGTEPGLILPNVTNSWFLAGSEVWVTVPRAKPLNLPLTTKEETSAGHHLCRYCPISHMTWIPSGNGYVWNPESRGSVKLI